MNYKFGDNSQYEGQYSAIVTLKDSIYHLRAFQDESAALMELQRSLIRGATPVSTYLKVSWKALHDLENIVSRANRGEDVDFKGIFNQSNL